MMVTTVFPAKWQEPIEMLFTVYTQVGPQNHILDMGAIW